MKMTQQQFLGGYAVNPDVQSIKILGHTGRSIFTPLEDFARRREEAEIYKNLRVLVLLRDEGVETPYRRKQIESAIDRSRRIRQSYSWLNVEVRFYSAIQTLRGSVVGLSKSRKHTYFSAYQWSLPELDAFEHTSPKSIKTAAVDESTIIKSETASNDTLALSNLIENWFDYYWGPGVLHTIAFDFDDTLIDTYKDKINAWISAIDDIRNNSRFASYLSDEFLASFGNSYEKSFSRIKYLLDNYPGKEEIITYILSSTAPPSVSEELDRRRSYYRQVALFLEGATDQAVNAHVNKKFFPDVKPVLEQLVLNGHMLAIASLTNEERIEDALAYANICCVDTIIGRNEYKHRELKGALTEKVHLIRKVARLAGVPAYRVLYVGDHHRDEEAAEEVGASFIQARIHPEIESSRNANTLYFENYSDLVKIIDVAERKMRTNEFARRTPIAYA